MADDVTAARRRLYLWLGVVVVGLVVIGGYFLMGDDDDGGDTPGRQLSVAECNSLQDQFDNQSEINEVAEPGSSTFDRSLDRMDQLDSELSEGGCY